MQTHLRAARTILAVAVCLGPFIFGCGHDHSTFYSSLTDADKAGEITRGWLPDFLPKSSHAIRQVYDLSPSTEWCEFEFAPADAQSLRKNVKEEVETLPAPVADVPNPHVSWWPRLLEGNLDVGRIHSAGFRLYALVRPATSVSTETWLFAIDWQNGRAFLYTGPEQPNH